MKILEIKVKVGVKGAEYQISAVPFNHQAYSQHTSGAPVHFEVIATNVGDFFKSNTVNDAENIGERDLTAPKLFTTPASQGGMNLTSSNFKVNSFADALNSWHDKLLAQGMTREKDTIEFDIHPDIAAADLKYDQAVLSLQDISMPSLSSADLMVQSIRRNNAKLDVNSSNYIEVERKTKSYNINAGTSVENVLSTVIRNSSYIMNQVQLRGDYNSDEEYDAYLESQKNVPVRWFKISPKVELLKFDAKNNVWARKITYQVIPYIITNNKLPYGPQMRAYRPTKRYNYIYTGQNNDIISFDLDFNTAYYTALTAYKHNELNLSMVSQSVIIGDKDSKSEVNKDANLIDANKYQPLIFKRDGGDKSITTTSDATTVKEKAAADMYRSIMSSSRGDMISVKLKIVGDPLFIKQDDMFYTHDTRVKKNVDPKDWITKNGSLLTDRGEIYVLLTLKTPVDIDESTGMMKYEKYYTSGFSGMYRVTTVVNEFRNGQFTQELSLVRLFVQGSLDYKDDLNATKSADERNNAKSVTASDQIGPNMGAVISADSNTGNNSTPSAKTNAEDGTPTNTTATDTGAKTEGQKIADATKDAPTEAITTNTAPQTTTPPPPPPTPLPGGVTQSDVTGIYQYKGVNLGGDSTGLNKTENINLLTNAVDTGSTVTYNYVDPVSGTVFTKTFNGATGKFVVAGA